MQSSTLPSKAVEQQKFSMISIEHGTGNKQVGDEYVLTQFHSDTMTKAKIHGYSPSSGCLVTTL
jgi:hypothetical protein